MTLGVIMSEPFGGWWTLGLGSTAIQVLLKGALALVLFNEAAELGMHRIAGASLSSRLLLVALPLVMIFGTAVALVMWGVLGFWEAAVIGILLSPTDAALGLPVIQNERVPERIRSGLVIEGGLNDGLAVPFALFAAAAAQVSEAGHETVGLIEVVVKEVGIALVVGIVLGWLSAKMIDLARERELATDRWIRAALIGLAVVTFALAEGMHASGFIAAWVAGLVLGRFGDEDLALHRRFSEDGSHLLVMLSFLVFGALAVGPLLGDWTWQIVLYAVLSLVLVRPAAVAISLVGDHDNLRTIAFLGWFGPRGLPTLVLALILIFERFRFTSGDLMLDVIVATVALSVYAHGFSAGPLSNAYADWCERSEVLES
jgi:NhaP-type Na+/H+ or K+/H+ antiporter